MASQINTSIITGGIVLIKAAYTDLLDEIVTRNAIGKCDCKLYCKLLYARVTLRQLESISVIGDSDTVTTNTLNYTDSEIRKILNKVSQLLNINVPTE